MRTRTATSRDRTLATSTRRPEIELLSRVPLFSGLSRSQLRRVAELAEEISYTAGRMIVRAGSPGVAFYVIVEGEAKVLKGTIATARGTWRLGPGDFFGELALLDGRPRSASVVAETTLRTIRIERAPFRRLLREQPAIALALLEGMAARMRGTIEGAAL
jgi:CRP/FNR family cyclic AMP-dependent transcriptional regulator